MAIEFEYIIDGNTLRGKASGYDENLMDTLRYSFAVVHTCIKHRCDHVLLDERKLEYKLNTGDTFNLAKSVAAIVPQLAWVAIVTSEDNYEDAIFFENTANNRGLHIHFFQEMEEAEAWLAGK